MQFKLERKLKKKKNWDKNYQPRAILYTGDNLDEVVKFYNDCVEPEFKLYLENPPQTSKWVPFGGLQYESTGGVLSDLYANNFLVFDPYDTRPFDTVSCWKTLVKFYVVYDHKELYDNTIKVLEDSYKKHKKLMKFWENESKRYAKAAEKRKKKLSELKSHIKKIKSNFKKTGVVHDNLLTEIECGRFFEGDD